MFTIQRAPALLVATFLLCSSAAAQTARISEETRPIRTYPFSEPNRIPMLTRDARLYPYHSFEGYATDGVMREWKVVRLENDWIEVFVLPEAGGKVWGAVVKSTGHEFIYRNEVMKFRNIALRGPWTSGGIEFNFGVIGHTPATATPVDYVLRRNDDGSVSCIVGTMDLPSRTHWRVEIRLPADRAVFETNVLWYNPTPLEQPYYNWMTAAAFARDDLEMFIPGNAYLAHSGSRHDWPVDPAGRFLPAYDNNRFGGHKSYHVVGELNDFFGGYYVDDAYGFGHWSRYEEMPGQKLWLWALSREGGVWEELLTDTDGQYVEFQAGRLFVQYSPGAHVNPITQAGFDPGAADRWTETWFPLEGIGGLTDASRQGAMHVQNESGRLTIRAHAFRDAVDTLRITAGNRVVLTETVNFRTLEPVEWVVDIGVEDEYRVELRALGLNFRSDPEGRELDRPFATDPDAAARVPDTRKRVFAARELAKGRRYAEARGLFESVVADDPWNREALLGLASLEYRRGLHDAGLSHVEKVRQLDAYDAQANFQAGNLYRVLGRVADARDAFGWAARSMAFRSVAYVQLAELMLADEDLAEAARYARLALDYDRYSVPARQILAIIARISGDDAFASRMRGELLEIDPLHHFALAEAYLAGRDVVSANVLTTALRSEYPDQTVLELAIDYVRRGRHDDAHALLSLGSRVSSNPLLRVWQAWLDGDPTVVPATVDVELVYPYRRETLPVLEWAAEQSGHWSWRYLQALNLWALDRADEAARIQVALADTPDSGPFYVARGHLLERLNGRDPEPDLRRAVETDRSDRVIRIQLIQHLQDRTRWDEAHAESATGRQLFPDDFNMDLLHVRSLIHLNRPLEAIEILEATQVLPSENARESHRLWEQAHVMAALDALGNDANNEAESHLQRALEWPEHLGQGKPYEPEERLPQYLLGLVKERVGDEQDANTRFEAVVEASTLTGSTGRLDLLAIPALAALDRAGELRAFTAEPGTMRERIARAMIGAADAGADPAAALAGLAQEFLQTEDLDGRLLLRALSLRH